VCRQGAQEENQGGAATDEPSDARFWIDHNGCLTEQRVIGGQEVTVHYDDIPPSDITVVDGIRCTTALRTVLDLAADVSNEQLHQMIRDSLKRQLFTIEAAFERANRYDIRDRVGTRLFIEALLDYV
jgi:hypothetical protein